MTNGTRALFLALIAMAAAVATTAIVFLTMADRSQPALAQLGGAFTLTGEDGQTVTEADFRGRAMLIFFGFTNCPDVCPVTLQRIADALESAPELATRLTPILISVDPERDTPAAMKAYVAAFGPQFRGLTGTPEQVAAVVKAYKVYAKKVPLEGSALGYTMDHSSLIYLYGPDGAFVTAFDPSLDGPALAAKLKETVKGSGPS
jgi:protein SCO1/2